MQCAWTDEKNEINIRRHGIPFAVAIEALDDPFALTKEDYIDDNDEQRYQTVAAFEGRLLMIAHVYRIIDGEEIPWIISIRKAVSYEKKEYNSQRHRT